MRTHRHHRKKKRCAIIHRVTSTSILSSSFLSFLLFLLSLSLSSFLHILSQQCIPSSIVTGSLNRRGRWLNFHLGTGVHKRKMIVVQSADCYRFWWVSERHYILLILTEGIQDILHLFFRYDWKARRNADVGSSLRSGEGFFSQSTFSADSLYCPYSPCVQSHASTSVRTLKIPKIESCLFSFSFFLSHYRGGGGWGGVKTGGPF